MEGLGIAANVIAVVDLAAKACTVVYQYAKSAKNCPKTVAQLQQELTAVKGSLDGLQKIARRLDDACTAAGEPPPVISELSTALKECSTTLSELTHELEGSYRNRFREKVGWRLRWPIRESEIAEFVLRLGRYQQTFQLALQADIVSIALDVKADVGEVRVGVQDVTTEIQKVQAEQSKDILDRATQDQREKLDQLVRWLAPLHYNAKHEQSIEKHEEDTGTWLFEKDIYRDWESLSPSSLWIHGIPGSGKTILASTIIERLETAHPGGSDCDVGFAYFYCQYNNEETKTPANVVRALLAQLLHSLDYVTVTTNEIVKDLFSKFSKGHGPPVDIKRISQFFSSVGRLYKRLIIVIDGLDECPMERRGDLLRFVTALASGDNTSILVVSRREVDIEEKLNGFSTISLEHEQINLKDDMRKVINKEFEDMEKWGRFQALKDEIAESLILGSGKNMFRWLECQLDLLSRLRTLNAVREALEKLPRTLFETYDRMLECIVEESSAELASKAFLWIIHSLRPLYLDELVEALALNENDRRLNRNKTFADSRDLLRICSGLLYEASPDEDYLNHGYADSDRSDDDHSDDVNLDDGSRDNEGQDDSNPGDGSPDDYILDKDNRNNNGQADSNSGDESSDDNVPEDAPRRREIKFCHYTVEEYFVSDYLRKHSKLSRYAVAEKGTERAQSQLAKLTLTYLLLDDFSEPCTSESQLDELTEKYDFYEYCVKHWIDHCKNVKGEDDSLFELVDSLAFGCPAKRRVCCQIYNRIIRKYGEYADDDDFTLRDSEPDQGYYVWSVCKRLVVRNQRLIIRHIIEKRPELLNKFVGLEGPILRMAILEAGNKDVVMDLLELGPDIHKRWLAYDLPDLSPGEISLAGSIGGAYNIPHDKPQNFVPDPNNLPLSHKDTPFEYPIHTISQHIPKFLPLVLRHGSDQVNIRSWNGSVPLHYAVLGKSLEAVQALIAAGADINAETNAGRTSFHIAVSLQVGVILDYLLDCEVTVPSDVTASELKWVGEKSAGDDDLNVKRDALERDARDRLIQKMQTFPWPQPAHPTLPDNWVRGTISREETVRILELPESPEPYVSIGIEGKSLKRIVFRILSNDSGNTEYVGYISTYRLPFSWFEAAVVMSPPYPITNGDQTTETFSDRRGLKIRPVIPSRHIQCNLYVSRSPRYHMVAWDVRDPTPGVKEWLEAIQNGDVINVVPMVAAMGIDTRGNHVHKIEVDVYCEN